MEHDVVITTNDTESNVGIKGKESITIIENTSEGNSEKDNTTQVAGSNNIDVKTPVNPNVGDDSEGKYCSSCITDNACTKEFGDNALKCDKCRGLLISNVPGFQPIYYSCFPLRLQTLSM